MLFVWFGLVDAGIDSYREQNSERQERLEADSCLLTFDFFDPAAGGEVSGFLGQLGVVG